MKKSKFYSLFALVILSVTLGACTDDFKELNTDPANATLTSTESEFVLFAKSALYGPHYMRFEGNDDGRGPFQLGHSLFPDVYANYFATTQPVFGSDQYELVGRWLNGAWTYIYEENLRNVVFAEQIARTNELAIEEAMMKVWRVYAFHRVTDLWGPVPYSEVLTSENALPYDSQESIYRDFFTSLDEAVSVLKANAGTVAPAWNGADEILHGGSVDLWLKTANTLRLRLAMRVRYVDAGLAQTEAEKAVADGVILLNEENAILETTDRFRNHYTTITQWGEFRMSADVESILKGYQDPRMATYFAEAATPDPTDDPTGVTFNFEGMRNGQEATTKTGTDFNSTSSNMATEYTTANTAGPAWVVLRAAEAFFLRAEGALLGWNMGGTSQDLYEQGIAASHVEQGYDGNDLSGNDYVTSTNVPAALDASNPAVSTIPVAFESGASLERQLEQIITQKWIAIWPDSEEAYAERRRTGYPTLYNRLNSINPNIAVDEIPRRMPYVAIEQSTNQEAVNTAIGLLNSESSAANGDQGNTKLWWDKKN
ncbi:MAG: SusD/RagB family nutrient-binding outer membrane lipoprotein [Bacteroidota bacterium]